MRLRIVVLLSLALSVGAACPSRAGDVASGDSGTSGRTANSSTYATLGPYVAVGGGAAVGDMGPGSAGIGRRIGVPGLYEVLETGSINLRAGWRFHPHLSGEVVWEYHTAWEFEAGSSFGIPSEEAHGEFHAWNLLGNLKLHLTTSRWQPFVMTGMGLGRRSLDTSLIAFDPQSNTTRRVGGEDEAFVARLGGGLDVFLNDDVTFGTELAWVIGTGALSALDYGVAAVVLAWHLPY